MWLISLLLNLCVGHVPPKYSFLRYVRNRRLSNLWGELYAGTTLFYEAIIFYNNAVIQCCKRNISPLGVVGLSGTSDHHCSAILMLFQSVGQTRKGPSLQILRKEMESLVKQSSPEMSISIITTWRFVLYTILGCVSEKPKKKHLRFKNHTDCELHHANVQYTPKSKHPVSFYHGSHFSGPDWKTPSHLSKFSSPSGNPVYSIFKVSD